jgi:hypothetical protein
MKPLRSIVIVRNLLVGAGAYYLSWWVSPLLEIGFGKLTNGITYTGDFSSGVVMPIVTGLPVALVAAVVGASVVWIVESETPFRWSIFPAALYAFFGYTGYHWARPPVFIDRLTQAVTALFLALACLGGGILAVKRRAGPRPARITPV